MAIEKKKRRVRRLYYMSMDSPQPGRGKLLKLRRGPSIWHGASVIMGKRTPGLKYVGGIAKKKEKARKHKQKQMAALERKIKMKRKKEIDRKFAALIEKRRSETNIEYGEGMKNYRRGT